MGIDTHGARFLAYATALGVSYLSTVTIGRQSWFCDVAQLRRATEAFSSRLRGPISNALFETPYADEYFRALGAERVDSVDYSSFEGASIVHDMNEPMLLSAEYSCVFDGGSSEHIFNVAQCTMNLMHLVAPGGHLLSVVPANDQTGHGFYQFSPEFFFRTYTEANGFRVKCVLIHVAGLRTSWNMITDPRVLGRRVQLATRGEANLYVVAQRISAARSPFVTPQQSDYARRWNEPTEMSLDASKLPSARAPTTRGEQMRQHVARTLPRRVAELAVRARRWKGTLSGAAGVRRIDLAAEHRSEQQ